MAMLAASVATAVSGVFGVVLLRRWQARGRKPALLLWGVAVVMFCVASAMLLLGAAAGWHEFTFRTFYLFGGVLNVPWLAAGSIAVNAPSTAVSRVTGIAAAVTGGLFALAAATGGEPLLWLPGVVLGLGWGGVLLAGGSARSPAANVLLAVYTAAAIAAVWTATLTGPLATAGIPQGRDLFPAAARGFAVGGNAVGAIVVVVSAVAASVALVWGRPPRGAWQLARQDAAWGATDVIARWLWSGRRGVAGLAHVVRGNLLIAVGVAIASAGGAFSVLGETVGHAVGLSLGVTVMYVGFRRTTRPLAAADRPRVEVFSRAGCGLCRRAEVRVAIEARGADVLVRDVDADPELQRRYHIRVPVVAVDGREVAELELAPGVVADAVRTARAARQAGSGPRSSGTGVPAR